MVRHDRRDGCKTPPTCVSRAQKRRFCRAIPHIRLKSSRRERRMHCRPPHAHPSESAIRTPAGDRPVRASNWLCLGVRTKCSGSQGGASRSEEHTSELQSLMRISYAVFCLKKKQYTNDTLPSISNTNIY